MAEGTLASDALAVKLPQVDWETLADNDPVRSEALRRWASVRRVLATPGLLWNAAFVTPVIAAVRESLKDEAPPSWHTVRLTESNC